MGAGTSVETTAVDSLLGTACSEVVLYIENRPDGIRERQNIEPVSIPELIDINGTHWRKIFTIFAKLASPDENWRKYRDEQLLKEKEAICFTPKLQGKARVHIISGKLCWESMLMNLDEFTPLDPQERLWVKGNILCCPYFDYRQFPNVLVEIARGWVVTQRNMKLE